MNKDYLTRKEQIVLSAVDIINELGIDGLSIRELAKKENITEGALYRHFKSKTEIIKSVLKYYSQYDNNIINTIKRNNMTARAGIKLFFNSLVEYYESYPEITSVACSYDSLLYEPELKKEVLQIINRRISFLISIIEEGKKQGELSLELDSKDLANVIFGYYKYMVFIWRIENYKFSLKEKVNSIISILLK